jgi:hypothetical protein
MEIPKMQTTNGKTNKGQIARSVRFDIATNKNDEFHTLFKNEILPILKKQDGFKDELLLVKDQHVLAIPAAGQEAAPGNVRKPDRRNVQVRLAVDDCLTTVPW